MTGCDGIASSPDEKHKIKQVVLVELYITEGCPACSVVEPILEKLANEYSREKMVLVEAAPWGLYSIPEVSGRYSWYLPNHSDRSVPNILFNGLLDRMHGVANYHTIKAEMEAHVALQTKPSVSSIIDREIKAKIEAQLAMEPVIELQASRTSNGTSTVFTGTVKNIGSQTLTNLVVNGMAFMDRGKTGFHYSVVDIFEDEKKTINSLTPGQEVEFTITVEGLNWEGDNLDGVIFVQSVNHEKKVIRQSVFLD